MASRVAVVTDSVSDGFYFPLFLSYYRRELPGADIFVVTPAGRASMFAGFGLAGVVELSIDFYDDTVRANAISDFVSELTERYTHVMRVDCDEFAIADPRRFASLQAYIETAPHDYVTAFGYDVVAAPSDPPLDFSKPILGTQRSYAFALNALNKTCLTRIPQKWGRGFHACQSYPKFDGLYLMHLKRADIDMQVRFGEFLAALTREDEYIRNYYLTPRSQTVSFHENLFRQEKAAGWDGFVDPKFIAAFFLGLKKSPDNGLWDIRYEISDHLVEIPGEFHERIGPIAAPLASANTQAGKPLLSQASGTRNSPASFQAMKGRQLHDTAFAIGSKFLELYAPAGDFTIVEIGSQDVNGSLRTALPERAGYIGVDAAPGRNVDVVAIGRAIPLPTGRADLVIASSVFEHDNTFWQTFLELCRLTKDGGYIYISAPSNGYVHRYPQDCWRFYPDSGIALAAWGREHDLEITLVESFVADRQADVWNDFVAVFRRGQSLAARPDGFVHNSFAARNIRLEGATELLNPSAASEDQELLAAATHTLLAIERRVAAALANLEVKNPPPGFVEKIKKLNATHPQRQKGSDDGEADPRSGQYDFIDTAIEALSLELRNLKFEALFRETSLRRRLQHLEAASGPTAQLSDSSTDAIDQVWYSIDNLQPDLIIGWAILVIDPKYRLTIDVYAGDMLVASSIAKNPRPHLMQWGYGDGNFGFGIRLGPREEIRREGLRVVAKWHNGQAQLAQLSPNPQFGQ